MMAGFAGSFVICNWIDQLSLLLQHIYYKISLTLFNDTISAHTNEMCCKICNFNQTLYQFFELQNIYMQRDYNRFQYKLNK